jgi:hypothetical protein
MSPELENLALMAADHLVAADQVTTPNVHARLRRRFTPER